MPRTSIAKQLTTPDGIEGRVAVEVRSAFRNAATHALNDAYTNLTTGADLVRRFRIAEADEASKVAVAATANSDHETLRLAASALFTLFEKSVVDPVEAYRTLRGMYLLANDGTIPPTQRLQALSRLVQSLVWGIDGMYDITEVEGFDWPKAWRDQYLPPPQIPADPAK